ncbi:MAG: B12-binding domain-containing radical SAM protein [Oscillospiraceae bacterium]
MKIIFAAINAKFPHTNIAVRYFNALCKGITNLTTNYVEYTINNTRDTILQGLMESEADVISFSCYIWNIGIVLDICQCIKQVSPSTIIILGGPEVSFYDSIDNLHCDYLIKGEGEREMLKLLTSILNNQPTEKICKSSSPFDINLLPFPYENELPKLQNRTLYYEASRGCPFKCSYCLSGSEHGVRFKDIETIKSELKIFIDAKVRQVKFVDRTFNCNKKICTEIWQFIKDNYNGITNFHFEISADLLDENMMNILSDMPKGLVQLEVGVQSTNPKTLESIHRTSDLSKLFDRVDRINSHENVHLHLDLIIGLPFEDYNTFKFSFNDVYSHNPQQLQLGVLKLLKGSSLYSSYSNYDMRFRHYPPYEVLSTDVLPYTDMIKLKKIEEVVELFYNSGRFESIIKFMEKKFPSPFDFYQNLGNLYFKNSHHLTPLSKEGQFNFLKDFYKENFGEIPDVFKDLCRFDIIRHEKPKKVPEWALIKSQISRLDMLNFLLDSDNIHKYLNQYSEIQPKDILSGIHIEEFDYDITAPEYPLEKTVILFDYNEKSILGRAKQFKIQWLPR